jgi:hypothetical protein
MRLNNIPDVRIRSNRCNESGDFDGAIRRSPALLTARIGSITGRQTRIKFASPGSALMAGSQRRSILLSTPMAIKPPWRMPSSSALRSRPPARQTFAQMNTGGHATIIGSDLKTGNSAGRDDRKLRHRGQQKYDGTSGLLDCPRPVTISKSALRRRASSQRVSDRLPPLGVRRNLSAPAQQLSKCTQQGTPLVPASNTPPALAS